MTGYVLFASMIIMLLVGVPISVTLGAATLAALLTLDVPLAVIPQRLFTALDASSIMAIPFFVLAGNFSLNSNLFEVILLSYCHSNQSLSDLANFLRLSLGCNDLAVV